MLNTPLTQLRKAAPGSLTVAKVQKLIAKRGTVRAASTIHAFETGQIREPDERFVELYAAAIGQPVDVVRAAHQRTVRARERAASR